MEFVDRWYIRYVCAQFTAQISRLCILTLVLTLLTDCTAIALFAPSLCPSPSFPFLALSATIGSLCRLQQV